MNGSQPSSEAHFYWAMQDLKELIEEYGAPFVFEKSGLDDVTLLEIHDTLHKHFLYKNSKDNT